MDIMEAIKSRNSVRSFSDKKIEGEVVEILQETIDLCNEISGLHFQLCLNEPKALGSVFFHYGRFKNCKNYIALVGPKGMDEKYGYYGEKIVLKAQQLGLNSCWIGLTYNKFQTPCVVNKGESIRLIIALGYGTGQGKPHKSKDISDLCRVATNMPDWFKRGMDAAMLAPTAINQQKFLISLQGSNIVRAKALSAPYSKIDLGIVKYHFEIGAGKQNFSWG